MAHAYLDVSRRRPPFERSCVVTGGTGFMGAYLVHFLDQVAAELGGREVHILDVAPPRPDMPPPSARTTTHQCTLSDGEAVERVFRAARPDTVFHAASLIDCRPHPDPSIDLINVDGTRMIIELCRKYEVRRLVYTSSIEVVYGSDPLSPEGMHGSVGATEERPYPPRPTQAYQRTKIEAERLVLAADAAAPAGASEAVAAAEAHDAGSRLSTLSTCSLRPAHIYGAGDDLFFLKDVAACFGPTLWPRWGSKHAARMTMVHVENMAAAHVMAAMVLNHELSDAAGAEEARKVAGTAINVGDFDENGGPSVFVAVNTTTSRELPTGLCQASPPNQCTIYTRCPTPSSRRNLPVGRRDRPCCGDAAFLGTVGPRETQRGALGRSLPPMLRAAAAVAQDRPTRSRARSRRPRNVRQHQGRAGARLPPAGHEGGGAKTLRGVGCSGRCGEQEAAREFAPDRTAWQSTGGAVNNTTARQQNAQLSQLSCATRASDLAYGPPRPP